MSAEVAPDPDRGLIRRVSAALFRHRKAKLALTLAPPLGWMLVVYLGALAVLLATAFWRVNVLTSQVEQIWGFQNIRTIASDPVYRTITIRTLGMAVAVTFVDISLAFPLAFYMA